MTRTNFLKDHQGATAVEYGLIAAVIAIGLLSPVQNVRDALQSAYRAVAGSLNSAASPAAPAPQPGAPTITSAHSFVRGEALDLDIVPTLTAGQTYGTCTDGLWFAWRDGRLTGVAGEVGTFPLSCEVLNATGGRDALYVASLTISGSQSARSDIFSAEPSNWVVGFPHPVLPSSYTITLRDALPLGFSVSSSGLLEADESALEQTVGEIWIDAVSPTDGTDTFAARLLQVTLIPN